VPLRFQVSEQEVIEEVIAEDGNSECGGDLEQERHTDLPTPRAGVARLSCEQPKQVPAVQREQAADQKEPHDLVWQPGEFDLVDPERTGCCGAANGSSGDEQEAGNHPDLAAIGGRLCSQVSMVLTGRGHGGSVTPARRGAGMDSLHDSCPGIVRNARSSPAQPEAGPPGGGPGQAAPAKA
jgi:hypothetical protein